MTAAIALDEKLDGQWSKRQWFSINPPPPFSVTTIKPVVRWKESRPASIHRTKDASGWRAPTPWSHSISEFRSPRLDMYEKWVDTFDRVMEDQGSGFCYSGLPTLPNLGNCVDLAVNKALLKLSNQQTDVGENFAERRQADAMIAERIDRYTSQLTGRYIARHNRDWRKVLKVSPFVRRGLKYPQSWLEFQYGALPLWNDVYGAYNLMKNIDKENNAFRVTAKGYVANDPENKRVTATISPGVYHFADYDVVTEGHASAFVRLDYCMVNPALHQLQQIGIVNPALLAWNLLPYSFVVDWALPVGNYLQSWTAALGLQFLGGSCTTYQKIEGHYENARYRDVDYVNVKSFLERSVELNNPGRLFALNVNRTLFYSSPAPRLPHFKNPLTLGHTANALSLLVQALVKHSI